MSPDIHHGEAAPNRRKDVNDSFQKILQSIESLSSRIDSLESRANQPETITDTDDDALSTMAGETSGLEFREPLATEASFTTATSPFRAPVEPIQAPVAPIKAPTKSSKKSDEAENSAKSSDDHGLFDPVAKSTSWKPSTSFSTFLDTNFRRKVFYQQSLVIMHDWATPEVDALSAPKLGEQ